MPDSMPQPLGDFAGKLLERADEYLEAFKRLSNSPGRELGFAMYFLFVHALEMLLKSYLAANGVSKKCIKSYNHKLERLLERCKVLGLQDLPDLALYVSHFAEMNRHHDFRYPSGYVLTVPRPVDCLEIYRHAREQIMPVVVRANLDAQLHFAANTRDKRGKKIVWSD
jgi:hypothetical protein